MTPTTCAAGHPLVPGVMLVGWVGCPCPAGGHRVYWCGDLACRAPAVVDDCGRDRTERRREM